VAIQLTSTGINTMLSAFLGSEDQILKLYSNDVDPIVSTTVSQFTEVTGGGYAEKNLNASSNWSVAAGIATTTPQTWEFTGAAGEVYGYYLVGATSGNLLAAEKFENGPYTVAVSGDKITVSITISLA
jgi:hypothetical protein